MPKPPENTRSFEALLQIIDDLLGPDGCEWDKSQTHASLANYAIEEAHEFVEAVEGNNSTEMLDELGDVLLQVVLHAGMSKRDGVFNIEDVIENLNKKMIRRHPHVFSNVKVNGTDDIWKNWDKLKAEENKNKPKKLFDIPASLPSLHKSAKIGSKTKNLDFDFPSVESALDKAQEELNELKQAIAEGNKNNIELELGDLLFTTANLARHLEIDPEQATRKTILKFTNRFETMLKICENESLNWMELPRDKKEQLWLQSKKVYP